MIFVNQKVEWKFHLDFLGRPLLAYYLLCCSYKYSYVHTQNVELVTDEIVDESLNLSNLRLFRVRR
jgi:hypothetical protein